MRKYWCAIIIISLGLITLTACDSKDSYVEVRNNSNFKI